MSHPLTRAEQTMSYLHQFLAFWQGQTAYIDTAGELSYTPVDNALMVIPPVNVEEPHLYYRTLSELTEQLEAVGINQL